jgi:2-succinyl-5-enolpyruvyl-6-hydroxy-3-cyclohexene-1-carboxylate synthase
MQARGAQDAFCMVLVDEFVRCGMTDACLAPGSRSTPLAIALDEDDRVKVHTVIDERSASFLALGIAKASERPVPVLCTSGGAAANLHPAVLEAHHSHTPLLVLTADRPPELRDTAANQTTDQLKLYGGAVRWFCEAGVPEALPTSVAYWRSIACRAIAEATGSPSGPVHLNLPFREPLVPTGDGFPYSLEGRAGDRPWTRIERGASRPSEHQVESLAAEISAVERGLIVVGNTEVAPGPVVELAQVAGWPLLAEATSGVRSGPNAISTYDGLLRDDSFRDAHRPELVVRIGTTVLSRSLARYLGPEVRQVLIDADGSWLDPGRGLASIVTAEPRATCSELCKSLEQRERVGWLESWRESEAAARGVIDSYLDSMVEPSEPGAARDIATALPDGSTLSVASSMPVRDLDSFMAPRTGVRFIANRGLSGIDGFVSTTLGASLGSGGRVFALAGDLSMIHDQNGLTLAHQADVGAVFVVLNNDGGGIFNFLPQSRYRERFERLWGTPHGLDFAKLAALYDCGYEKIEESSHLIEALNSAPAGSVHILELQTDREANKQLHLTLWKEVSEAISSI